MKCVECLSENTECVRADFKKPYQYLRSGLNNFYLVGIEILHCRECGVNSDILPRLGPLHDLIASLLLNKPYGLNESEIKFLRKHSGISADAFSKFLPSNDIVIQDRVVRLLARPTDSNVRMMMHPWSPPNSNITYVCSFLENTGVWTELYVGPRQWDQSFY